jgi:hypothetical protein
MAGAPRRRSSRRRSYSKERVCANRKRRKDGKFAPGRGSSRRRGGAKRRSSGRRRTANGRFAKRRHRVKGYTATRRGKRVHVKRYLREEDLMNPIGGNLDTLLENPITIGETWTLFAVAGAGWVVTDLVSRYLETSAGAPVSPTLDPSTGNVTLPNAVGSLGMPSWTNIFVQAGISVAALGVGGYLGKGGGGLGVAALNGLGVGAGLHLIGQLATALMARMAGSKTSAQGTTPTGTLSRLYAGEIAAQNIQYAAATQAAASTPAGKVVPGFAGIPDVLGTLGAAPVRIPQYGQPVFHRQQPVNHPVATLGVPAPYVPAPVTASGSGASAPWADPNDGSRNGSDCGCMGFTPYSTFPD